MWIRQIARQLRQSWRSSTLEPPPKKPDRALCAELLRKVSPVQFEYYVSMLGMSRLITVSYARIDNYTAALNELATLVEHDGVVSREMLRYEEHLVSFDRFLTSGDGYYLQPSAAVEKFRKAALRLCEAMESSDYTTYGPAEHNLRMLSRMFLELQMLARQMIEVSAST